MTNKQKLLSIAKKNNIEVEYGGRGTGFEIRLIAPDKHYFAGHGVHELVHSIWDDDKPSDLWKSALNDLSYEGDFTLPCKGEEHCSDWDNGCQFWA